MPGTMIVHVSDNGASF